MTSFFSIYRLWAVIIKEFIQLRRDRMTFAMMIAIPLMQMILFGYAINTDPRNLPSAIIADDKGQIARNLINALEISSYFDIVCADCTRKQAETLINHGKIKFIFSIPHDFEKKIIRQEKPQVLLEADASDPVSIGGAVFAMQNIVSNSINHIFTGSLTYLQTQSPPFGLIIHKRYNPEGITHYNIVPGLIGVILTMTMVMITALALTRESERGTMENLLAMPVRTIELLLGKIIPYIVIGYIQVTFVLFVAWGLFNVPFVGSLSSLYLGILIYIFTCLCLGITISSAAKSQMQALQGSFFVFLPQMLLSGFMFPFYGMPEWAQAIGNVLPLTYFLRFVRGIMLKGNNLSEIIPHIIPLLIIATILMIIAIFRFRRTLD